MSLNFMSVCPYCHKHVAPLRISDIMECPLCGGVSKLVIETVSDEPKMWKKGIAEKEVRDIIEERDKK